MFTNDGIVVKTGSVWQAVQAAPDLIGIWFDGRTLTVKSLKLVWQFEHSPVVGWGIVSFTKNVPAVGCGRV